MQIQFRIERRRSKYYFGCDANQVQSLSLAFNFVCPNPKKASTICMALRKKKEHHIFKTKHSRRNSQGNEPQTSNEPWKMYDLSFFSRLYLNIDIISRDWANAGRYSFPKKKVNKEYKTWGAAAVGKVCYKTLFFSILMKWIRQSR